MSHISIIGTGNMARTLGALAIRGGHAVEIMGRDRSKATELAKTLGDRAKAGTWGAAPVGEIVIVAVLHSGVVPAVAAYGDALAGKIVVDISNPLKETATDWTTKGSRRSRKKPRRPRRRARTW